MARLVHKYGGTSVKDNKCLWRVARRIKHTVNQGHQVIVVLSAQSGVTNELTKQGGELIQSNKQPSQRELDVLLSTGEMASAAKLALCLIDIGVAAASLNAFQCGITTDNRHGHARIKSLDTRKVESYIQKGVVPVIAGYQGLTEKGDLTTLGRGGSDISAVGIAIGLRADCCYIYTDVDGVYAADPRLVTGAKLLPNVTFEEMLEAASLGAKVLHPRSVNLAGNYGMPLRVLSSLNEDFEPPNNSLIESKSNYDAEQKQPPPPGTFITWDKDYQKEFKLSAPQQEVNMEQPVVSLVTQDTNVSKVMLTSVRDTPGIAAKILGAVAEQEIEVDVIVQNSGSQEGTTDFNFTVKSDFVQQVEGVLNGIREMTGAEEARIDSDVAKVSVVGVGMRSQAGVAARAFKALNSADVNIQMIATSEIKITTVIEQSKTDAAVLALCHEFDLVQN